MSYQLMSQALLAHAVKPHGPHAPHITYLQAVVTGLIQGVTELFPVSSLGHNVLVPALIGGNWAAALNVSAPKSPYLAFIVGLHVATAIAMIAFFWRDWLRIVRGFFSSLAQRRITTPDQRLAWMIILATIPVGIVGAAAQHEFTKVFAKPDLAAAFLAINGVILLISERMRRNKAGVSGGSAAASSAAAAAAAAAAGRPGYDAPGYGGPGAGGPGYNTPGYSGPGGGPGYGGPGVGGPGYSGPGYSGPGGGGPGYNGPGGRPAAGPPQGYQQQPEQQQWQGPYGPDDWDNQRRGDGGRPDANGPGQYGPGSWGAPPAPNQPGQGYDPQGDRQAAGRHGRHGNAGNRAGNALDRAAGGGQADPALSADLRLSTMGYLQAVIIGAAQILALLPGISRDGIVTVAGMGRGLTRQDAVRFSFLLSAPVILAAGALKAHDLTGPLSKGIHGPIVVGSLLAGIGAYLSIRFLTRYFSDEKSLSPFGIYCLIAGIGSLAYLLVK